MKNSPITLQEVFDLIAQKTYQLNFDIDIPDAFKANSDVLSAILEHSSLDFEKLPDSAKNDRAVLMLFASKKSYDFQYFPDWAKDDAGILAAALSDSGSPFEYASERLRSDREIVMLALRNNSCNNLEHVASEELKNDKEILKIAVAGHSQAFNWVPEKWRTDTELLNIILSKEVTAHYSFQYFPMEYRDNEEVAIKVINDDYWCYQYLSDRLRNKKEIALLAATRSGDTLRDMPEAMLDDKDVVLAAMTNEGWRYVDSISARLKGDIDVVIAAVLGDNRSLESFPDAFKDNEKVIQACLQGGGSAYAYFSDRFKNDREIARQMSSKWNFDLSAVPESLRNDKEIVRNAVKESSSNYAHVGAELLNDVAFLKELYALNDGILSYMDQAMKHQLFTTTIHSVEHHGRKLVCEILLDDGPVQDEVRPVKKASVMKELNVLFTASTFPVLVYEEDGPVGSYLSVRYLNNIVLSGRFNFFVKENSEKETWTNHQSGSRRASGYGPEAQASDRFLFHEVYLIPDTIKEFNYDDLALFPQLYAGRARNLPRGICLFPTEDSYREALMISRQETTHGNPPFRRVGQNMLEATTAQVDEIFGAARVYVDGFGWRFLIPHVGGAMKALEVLRSTTDSDDLSWIRSQTGPLSDAQQALLKAHFGELKG